MPFGLNEAHLFYLFAAVTVVLVAEALYLLFFSAASYRSNVNRRLRMMNNQVDRQAILLQLRRERGLTSTGDFRLPIVYFNRLILQSGLSIGLPKFGLACVAGAVIAFAGGLVMRFSLMESALIAAFAAVILPLVVLFFCAAAARRNSASSFPTPSTSSFAACVPDIRSRWRLPWSAVKCPIRSAESSAWSPTR
jgi:tight adherence protein B